MQRVMRTLGVVGFVLAHAATALADAPAPPRASTPAPASAPAPAPAPAPALAPLPAPAPSGLAVVALAGATDAAWPLAQAVYADPVLRPTDVDEPHARVLCGEPAAATDPSDLRDLSDTVAALRGEDAPSRSLLDGLARRFAVRAIVVVRSEAGHSTARVFLADTGAFDGATYSPDAGLPVSWSAATRSLDRVVGPAPGATPAASLGPAPALATQEAPRTGAPSRSKAFYESGWFWGALGAAALAGGAAFLATRDSSPSTIHLEVQVPH